MMQRMLGFWMPSESKRYSRVVVAGKDVLLTASQARRYEELIKKNACRLPLAAETRLADT